MILIKHFGTILNTYDTRILHQDFTLFGQSLRAYIPIFELEHFGRFISHVESGAESLSRLLNSLMTEHSNEVIIYNHPEEPQFYKLYDFKVNMDHTRSGLRFELSFKFLGHTISYRENEFYGIEYDVD